jgi:hypothetical protein
MWSHQSARLATKSQGGTKLPPPCCRLPSKVVPRRCLACPRSCSLCLVCRFIVAAPLDRVGVLGGAPPPPQVCLVREDGGSLWSRQMSRVVSLDFVVWAFWVLCASCQIVVSCFRASFSFCSSFFALCLR